MKLYDFQKAHMWASGDLVLTAVLPEVAGSDGRLTCPPRFWSMDYSGEQPTMSGQLWDTARHSRGPDAAVLIERLVAARIDAGGTISQTEAELRAAGYSRAATLPHDVQSEAA